MPRPFGMSIGVMSAAILSVLLSFVKNVEIAGRTCKMLGVNRVVHLPT